MSESRKCPDWLLRIFSSCMRTPTKEPLKILDFSHGLLTDVPDEVYLHERTLEELYLSYNHLTDLPRQLFSCDELRLLDLQDNNISMLPPIISHLHNLEVLELGHNNIQELPENLKNNKKLRVLGLANNPLYKIPDVFQNLLGLTVLYLNETALEFIPAHIGKLTHLKILELRDNVLQDLPKTIHYLTKLERIDIGNNDLHVFPEEICGLFNLTELLLDQNQIESMPAGVEQLVNLRHFDISFNNLVSLHHNIGYWTKLEDLIATHNTIEAVPATIGNLKCLQVLKLESNRIKTIPTSIGSLVELEELIMTFNFIDVLPERIGLLRKLKILHLDRNFLTSLPIELGSCVELQILSLHNNRLTRLPEELSNLKKLRVINVVDNNLTYLPLAIGKMDLGAIWLNTNQAQPLVPLLPEDLGTGIVLNSVYLPQTHSRDMGAMVREREYQNRTAKHLCFSDHDKMSEGLEPTSRLSRSPTPFPKDLRKHARPVVRPQPRDEEGASMPLLPVPQPEEYRAVSTQGSEAIRFTPDPNVDVRPSTSAQTYTSFKSNAYESAVLFFMSPKIARKTVSFVQDSVMIPHLPLALDASQEEVLNSAVVADPEGAQAVVAQESNPLIREARNIRTDHRSPQPSEQESLTPTDSDIISERSTVLTPTKRKTKPSRIAEALAPDPRALKRVVPKLDLRIHSSGESSHRRTSEPQFYGPGQSDSIPTTPASDGRFPNTLTDRSLQSSSLLSPRNPDSCSFKDSVISGVSGTFEYIRTTSTDPSAVPAGDRSVGAVTHGTRDIEFSEDGQASYTNGSRSTRTTPTPLSDDGDTPNSNIAVCGDTSDSNIAVRGTSEDCTIDISEDASEEASEDASSLPPKDDAEHTIPLTPGSEVQSQTSGTSANSVPKSSSSNADSYEGKLSMNGSSCRTPPPSDHSEDLKTSRSSYTGRRFGRSAIPKSMAGGSPRSTTEQPRRPVYFNPQGEDSLRSLRSTRDLGTPRSSLSSERRGMDRESLRSGPRSTPSKASRLRSEIEAASINGNSQRSISDIASIRSDYGVPRGSLPPSTSSMPDDRRLRNRSECSSGASRLSRPRSTLTRTPGRTESRSPLQSISDVGSLRGDYSVPSRSTATRTPLRSNTTSPSNVESLRNDYSVPSRSTATRTPMRSDTSSPSNVESLRKDYSVPSRSTATRTPMRSDTSSPSNVESLRKDYSVPSRSTATRTPMRSDTSSPSNVESLRNDYSVPSRSTATRTPMRSDISSPSNASLPGDTVNVQPWTETEVPPQELSQINISDVESSKSGSGTQSRVSRPSLPGSTVGVEPWTPQPTSLTETEAQVDSGDSQRPLPGPENLSSPNTDVTPIDGSQIPLSTTSTPKEEISQRSIKEVENFISSPQTDPRIGVLPESSIITVQSRPPTPTSSRVDLTKRSTPSSDCSSRMSSRTHGETMESVRRDRSSESDRRMKPPAPPCDTKASTPSSENFVNLETLREVLGDIVPKIPQLSLASAKKKSSDSEESLLGIESFRTDSGSRQGKGSTPSYTGDTSSRTVHEAGEINRNINEAASRHSSRDHSQASGDSRSQQRSTKSSHGSEKKTPIEEPQNGVASKPQPPPYHIAKQYSNQAQYFEQDNLPGSIPRNASAEEEEVARIAGFDRPCLSSVGEGSIPESPTPQMFSERPAPGEHLVVPKPHRLSETSIGSQSPFGGHRQPELSSMHSSPRTDTNLPDVQEAISPAPSTPFDIQPIPPFSGSSRSDLPTHRPTNKVDDPRRVKTAEGRLGEASYRSNKVSPSKPRTPSKWMFGKHKNATVVDLVLDKPDDIGFDISENRGDGIYVESVFLESASMLQIGDKILALEGQDVSRMSKEEVLLLLRNAGSQISVMVSKNV